MSLISTKTNYRCLLLSLTALFYIIPGFSLDEENALLGAGGAAWHCPDEHVYIECGELHDNLDYYGYPKATYGYSKDVHISPPTVHKYLDKCGRGKIIRTWKIKYHYQWYTCQQTIHIKEGYGGAFDGSHDVHWPKDYHLKNCSGSMHPDKLPYGHNWPQFKHTGCSKLGLRYDDKAYPHHGGYNSHNSYGHHAEPCKVIYRTWELIDWCQYDEHHKGYGSHQPGRWTYVQKIYVYDDEAPEITYCPGDVDAHGGDCKGGKTYVEIPKLVAKDDCSEVYYSYTKKYLSGEHHYGTYGSSAASSNHSGNNASGYFEPGVTLVTFKAFDVCGNTSECELKVTVTAEDNKPPSVLAISSLTVSLMQTDTNSGYITLWPKEFNQSSRDNCTAPEDLQFSLEPDTFTCEDFGSNMVKFIVTDEAGNSDYAMVEVIVQTNSFDCLGGTIAGNIMSDDGNGVGEVEVSLMEGMQKMTNQEGVFAFDKIPLGRTVDITPFKDTDVRQGVDMYDYALLSMHVKGYKEIRDPYQLIAADVDGNKVVDQNDLYELHDIILGISQKFTNNTSWKFVPMDYQFPDTVSVLEALMPASVAINPYDGGDMDVQFRGIKVGDLGSLLVPEVEGDVRGDRSLTTTNLMLEAGQVTNIPFRFGEQISANSVSFSLQMENANLELVDIIDGVMATRGTVDFASPSNEDQILSGSFFSMSEQTFNESDILFELVVRAKKPTYLSNSLSLTSSIVPAETAGITGGRNNLTLAYKDDAHSKSDLSLYQNSPNPFVDETVIGFYMPDQGTAHLTIQDANGRSIFTRSAYFDKGYQQITLDRSELNTSGLLFYQLEHNGVKKTKKMIVIR